MVQVKAKSFKVVRLVCGIWSIGWWQVFINTVMMLIIVRLFLDNYSAWLLPYRTVPYDNIIVCLTFIN